jgi:hypothetical protein
MTKTKRTRTKYDIYYKGEFQTTLNASLLKRKNLEGSLSLIKRLHIFRINTEQKMSALDPVKDKAVLRQLYDKWLNNEHRLQEAWLFPINDNMIRTWNVPHCHCPKSDNEEFYGTEFKHVVSGCPIHGN